ncbi:hypothetical protein WH47_12564 [Habropoda laboriosa]|uniref:DUF5641 domain-containing protein n=2 Tax=Habropoda laboriosa TaxID=597456 RepID=A0A0L7QKY5_9HYME|nr:hypothetical protein WH47_12564 [Habropoda laboriosa]
MPPHSPHFGGLWESAVKSVKHHIKRVIGDQRLTYEELYTFLTQVESCLNSRPLSPLSDDPNDLNPLTPGHFIIGDLLTALPQQDLRDINPGRLKRYQLLKQMFQHFWSRWSMEYLHNLQQRVKWRRSTTLGFKAGDMVVIKEPNLPPLKWMLARITETHPRPDAVSRVLTLRTAEGILKRPITKVCFLPTPEEDANEENDTRRRLST